MNDFLVVVAAALIWIPLLPFRIILHGGIVLWRRWKNFSYLFFLLYWASVSSFLLMNRLALSGWRFGTFPGAMPIGLIFLIASLLFHTWTIRTLGLVTFVIRPEMTRTASHVVETGPYRYVRHPFYLMEWFLLLGLALFTSSSLILLLFAASVLISPVVTILEEKELVERFGDPYRAYQRRVPRLIPLLKGICSKGVP